MDPLENTRVRTWVDNTGQYETVGRLIVIADDFVRLLKSNGKTCTVSNDRLCKADAAYVESIKKDVERTRVAMLSAR